MAGLPPPPAVPPLRANKDARGPQGGCPLGARLQGRPPLGAAHGLWPPPALRYPPASPRAPSPLAAPPFRCSLMHPLEIPEGINENNAGKVVVDVSSFSTIEDGRSVYRKGRPLEWWVDSEEYSIIDMEKDVSEHFSWATNQEANFWFTDHNGQTSRLATDHQLLALLQASKDVKFVMTVDRCIEVT
ncbi:hypothetical protein PAHAL_9G324700 [Panicum hallii]|uniref:Uncharacterized protein n=1 Tax=Panicum hallii TaxID=206008 RepID=A0A2S3IN63_9POAL|nr:hypothetical protein PAHAL_9G324700 [Panicum hallii]